MGTIEPGSEAAHKHAVGEEADAEHVCHGEYDERHGEHEEQGVQRAGWPQNCQERQ